MEYSKTEVVDYYDEDEDGSGNFGAVQWSLIW